jgi:hypothetical protein
MSNSRKEEIFRAYSRDRKKRDSLQQAIQSKSFANTSVRFCGDQ